MFPGATVLAQQGTPAGAGPASAGSPPAETDGTSTSAAETLTFTKRVGLVVVPVVVRDKEGKAIGSLKREDFHIFDDGKPQSLSTFSIETSHPVDERSTHQSSIFGNVPIDKALGVTPAHFFAYLFDDLHLESGDLMQVRAAAKKHLESTLGADDRVAILSTSGDIVQGFTNDKALLAQVMDRIKPAFTSGDARCPYMNYYLAKKILDESGVDSITPVSGTTIGVIGAPTTPALDAATDDAWTCTFNRAEYLKDRARQIALDAAHQAVQTGDANTRRALLAIEDSVQRLAAMPGTRTLILVSPGFQTREDHNEQNAAIALATERNIVINALDARGLYTGANGADNVNMPSTADAARMEAPINREAMLVQANVMAELADGTGGKFFRDSNDLLGGFHQLATAPEYVYLLTFKPANIKPRNRYHLLKVTIGKEHRWTVQARRGYYESANAGDPASLITGELQDALFSRDEIRNLPITLKTEYATKDGTNRELLITTHLDAKQINFHKVNDKNVDELTLVCGLFDLNGHYLQGKKQEISMHMDDDVLKQVTAGMNVKTTFEVQPGAYMIRVVVRDSGDQLLSAVNGAGMIP